jgi:molybdenum cofactor cytidylyltransferase
MSRTFALIPAAGKSARMGRAKLLLTLGGRSILERVVSTLRAAGIDDVLVVVGPHVSELPALATAAGAHVLTLADETPDMRTTVEKGLDWLEEHFHPGPDDAWLLVPADHPTLAATVIRALFRAQAAHSQRSIFIPTFEGRRGHPALIGWRHGPAMRALIRGQGLNVYLRGQAEQTLEVPVDSADVLLDLDTPEDYRRLLDRS